MSNDNQTWTLKNNICNVPSIILQWFLFSVYNDTLIYNNSNNIFFHLKTSYSYHLYYLNVRAFAYSPNRHDVAIVRLGFWITQTSSVEVFAGILLHCNLHCINFPSSHSFTKHFFHRSTINVDEHDLQRVKSTINVKVLYKDKILCTSINDCEF